MLEVRRLSVSYGQHPALQEVSITVGPGEIVAILGANGAGKSTLLRAIAGICEGEVSGEIQLGGQALLGLGSDAIVDRGIALVPEGRGIFGELSVHENLLLGAYSRRARADEASNAERVLSLFPKLRERRGQIARTMSGGEQQMVAIGRAMMSAPEILMLDEPSLGLAPVLCRELFGNLATVRELGIGVLLVEQNAKQSLAIADRGYLLENTRITHEDSAANLARDPAVQKAYLGAGRRAPAPSGRETETPAAAPVRPRPQPRRTADQQVGLSIEELVQGAAQSSVPPRKAVARPAKEAARDGRLSSVLTDIERAAAEARRRASERARPAGSADSGTAGPGPEQGAAEAPPPVIEIYRRPKVEVYRRRPDGKFERD